MQLIFEINGIDMKLKLLIALVAVPTLVVAQPFTPSENNPASPGYHPFPNAAGQVGAQTNNRQHLIPIALQTLVIKLIAKKFFM